MLNLDRIEMTEGIGYGSLMTRVEIPYPKMVLMLGEPNSECDDYKTDVEWSLKFDGVDFYIYNYKDGQNYCGSSGLPNICLSDFHIGGNDRKKAIELANYLLDNEPNKDEDFPAISEDDIDTLVHRIRKLGYVEYTQVKNFLDEIGV